MEGKRVESKRGQVAIFIIVGIVIVAGIVSYFVFRDSFSNNNVPENLKPVYDYYLSCLQEHAERGVQILGEQGGYIEKPDFERGSPYMPFSSELDFFGNGIPYWIYVSGNNIFREQKPSKGSMEEQLEIYVQERVQDCDFYDFFNQNFEVDVEEGSVGVSINELDVDVTVRNGFSIFRGNESAFVNSHELVVESKLGKFYDLASKVYDSELDETFLENYGLDVMRLYAPVTGTETGCSPIVFDEIQIKEDIASGLETNVAALKLSGSYYDLANQDNSYFVVDIGESVDENVNFVYSSDWPTRIEIYGDLVVEPVGLQRGLTALGFCYTPYHLVYDINYPVLVQFYDTENLFQFPMAVIISKSQARDSVSISEGVSIESGICEFRNQDVEVYTYDLEFNPVEANVRFKCLQESCHIGSTEIENGNAILEGQVPQCVNGFIYASAEGYTTSRVQISTNTDSVADILLNKLYDIDLNLGVSRATVYFESETHSTVVQYPDFESVKLSEGLYNITVYAYTPSSLTTPAINERKCVDVPREGIGGLIGLEEEECFDIELPSQKIENAVIGGGEGVEYITTEQLRDSSRLDMDITKFDNPTTIEDVQENYALVDSSSISLRFV